MNPASTKLKAENMTTPHIQSIGRSPLRFGFLLITFALTWLLYQQRRPIQRQRPHRLNSRPPRRRQRRRRHLPHQHPHADGGFLRAVAARPRLERSENIRRARRCLWL
jgi:hypothetical protein